MEKISYPKEIQIFFNEIILEVTEVLDPNYILIAGSFGKESWLYEDDTLISDFEFVFVCNHKWSLKKKRKLLIDLNNMYDYDISLKGYLLNNINEKIISNYSKKPFNYIDLNFFDTFSDSTILFSKNNTNLDIKFSCSEIPAWEAWRLYVNRLGDLLNLLMLDDIEEREAKYYWLKFYESIGDSYLILQGNYNKIVSERVKLFENVNFTLDSNLSEDCIRSIPIIKSSLNARHHHHLDKFEIQNFNIENHIEIVTDWLVFFEKKVKEQELTLEFNDDDDHSYINYLQIQRRYLEFEGLCSIPLSNLLRLITNPKKIINKAFKFYNFRKSWRHIILYSVANIYQDLKNESEELLNTRTTLSMLIPNKYISKMTRVEVIAIVFKYWKLLR